MKLLSKTRWIYGICAFLTLSFVLSYAQADESSLSDPSSSTTSTSGCTTVTVVVNGPDWVPSATYQPCNTPPGTQEKWHLPWEVGKVGYSETKDVASNSPFIIGRTGESCSWAPCSTFYPSGDTYTVDCCGCISGAMPGCIQGKTNDHCEEKECSTN